MKTNRQTRPILLALVFASIFAQGAVLEISVRHTFTGEPLLLDSLRYQNSAAETLSFTRVSYLLSGFAFEREDGVWVEIPGQYAWMDAEKRRLSARLEGVPEGKYRALRFHIGPDATANSANPASLAPNHPLNANFNGLHWTWQSGYIFLALEGRYRATVGSELSGYSYHFARTPNRTRINLAVPLDLTHDAGVLLDFDLAALLNAPRPLAFARDGAATHSRVGDPVAAALAANLPGAFRVRQVTSAAPAISQPSPIKPLYMPEKFTPYRFTMSGSFPAPDMPSHLAKSCSTKLNCRAMARSHAHRATWPTSPTPTLVASARAWTARLGRATRCRSSISHGRRVSFGTDEHHRSAHRH